MKKTDAVFKLIRVPPELSDVIRQRSFDLRISQTMLMLRALRFLLIDHPELFPYNTDEKELLEKLTAKKSAE